MAEIQLYTFKFTPFGQRVAISLTEKKAPFDVIDVDFSNKPQALLDGNPIYKKVPLLIHNGKSVAESLVILEYLEDAFPEVPLLPEDAFEKSQYRFWADYVYKSFPMLMESMYTKRGTPERQTSQEAVEKFYKTLESAMTGFSPDGPYFTGDKFGYLDVILAPLINVPILYEEVAGIPIPGPDVLPRYHKWIATVSVYPSVKAFLPTREEIVAYAKERFAQAAAAAAPTH